MNVLFTCWDFSYYSGSQMLILEMARYLRNKNIRVDIISANAGPNFVEELRNEGISLYNFGQVPLDVKYDIVFAYHYPILPYLIMQGLQYKRIVNGVLSIFASLENPIFFHEKLELLPCCSKEIMKHVNSKYGIPYKKLHYLPNFLPQEFIDYKFEKSSTLSKIAVVSNHIPEELKQLPEHLKNIKVDFYGLEFTQAVISPELLSGYDVIISIGKTVQYALGMGIPVYEYDRFGGCGYITKENFEVEEEYNFSGRATNRKLSTKEIAKEITSGFIKAGENSMNIKNIAISKFSLKENMEKLLKRIKKTPKTYIDINKNNIIYFDMCKNILEFMGKIPEVVNFEKANKPNKIKRFAVKTVCSLIPNKNLRKKIRKEMGVK